MVKNILALLLLVVVFSCSTGMSVNNDKSKTLSKKKILFLAGRRSHAVGEHEHKAGCMILAKALNESALGFEASVVTKWPKDLAAFDGVDAVVVFADAGGRYSPAQLEILDKKVKAGMGIMFIHYGVHPSKQVGQKYFLPWMGGYFENDLSVNPHWAANVIPKANHPVSHGIDKPFWANDEFYYQMRFPDKKNSANCYPLAQAVLLPENVNLYNNLWNEHGDGCFGSKVTLMWCRDPKAAGRGVGFTGGHFHHNWAIDGFRTMVLNGIAWIARREVPKEGVVSAKVTAKQLNENLDGIPKKPLTVPVMSTIKKPMMLRPKDPKNYHQRNHYKLVRAMKAKKAQKK